MKVFKFYSGDLFYAVSGKTETEAKEYLFEFYAQDIQIDKVEEIPESKWDEKIIEMYGDNDREKTQFHISIRDALYGDDPIIVYTNDDSLTD